ncbi:MAG: general secretion pathway protein M [Halieaceae bacterium]|jgi:general secretion pathway protein M
MSWLKSHRQSALLVGLTLLLPTFFYLQSVFGLLGLGFDYAGQQGRIEPRLSRLYGLLENEEALGQSSLEARERLRGLVHPATTDASSVAASLQADIRQILTEAGLSVSNSQVMATRRGEDFDRVAVRLTMAGSLSALDTAMVALAAYRPQLLIETLDAFPARPTGRNGDRGEDQMLTAVMQVMSLLELP